MSTNNETVIIFDTTLRDGEQSPGCSMNTDEKIEVAKALVELGEHNDKIYGIATRKVRQTLKTGTPAVKCRANKLLKLLRHR